MKDWTEAGTRGFWVVAIVAFLVLELGLRIKLGSVFVVIGFWAIGHQAVSLRLYRPGFLSASPRLLFAFLANTAVAGAIFLVFAAGNAVLRTLNPEWRWLQLP